MATTQKRLGDLNESWNHWPAGCLTLLMESREMFRGKDRRQGRREEGCEEKKKQAANFLLCLQHNWILGMLSQKNTKFLN